MREIVIYNIDEFDRIVLRKFRFIRQNLCMNINTGICVWRDVKRNKLLVDTNG